VVVHAYVKPQGDRLSFLLRLPLSALLDFDLPRRGDGYLDLARVEPALLSAADAASRDLQLLEDEAPLRPARIAARVSLPWDRSFAGFESALANIAGPHLGETENLAFGEGYLDAHLEYPIRSPNGSFALRAYLMPGLGERVHLAVRFVTSEGAVRAYDLKGGVVAFSFDPRWHQAVLQFVRLGVEHILGGIDHLLFLLCLIVPFRRRFGGLIGVVTAFTAGHSLTLVLAAQGFTPAGVWFAPTIETLIALTILYMAIENVIGSRFDHRWFIALAFGLIHGFGFAGALSETLQFAGAHLLLSLLAFNVGIELGQIGVLLVAVPVLNALFRHPGLACYGAIIVSIIVGHQAWHWLTERVATIPLAELPSVDMAFVYRVGLWALTGLFVAAAGWIVARPLLRRSMRAVVPTGISRSERSRADGTGTSNDLP
jgi:hypothetical protein